jgi:hypothetical protein
MMIFSVVTIIVVAVYPKRHKLYLRRRCPNEEAKVIVCNPNYKG